MTPEALGVVGGAVCALHPLLCLPPGVPFCYCKQCIADGNQPQWIERSSR